MPVVIGYILLGDLNTEVGMDDQTWKGVIEGNGDPELNANGKYLLDFSASF